MDSVFHRELRECRSLSPQSRLQRAANVRPNADHIAMLHRLHEADVELILAGRSAALIHGLPTVPNEMTAYIAPTHGNYQRLKMAMWEMHQDDLELDPLSEGAPFRPLLWMPEPIPEDVAVISYEDLVYRSQPFAVDDFTVLVPNIDDLRGLARLSLLELDQDGRSSDPLMKPVELLKARESLSEFIEALAMLTPEQTRSLEPGL